MTMLKSSKIILTLMLLFAGTFTSAQMQAAGTALYSLDDLMLALAENGANKARFSETRTSRLTRKALNSSGVLEFSPPDVLLRHIIQPREILFEVRADKVTIVRKGKSQTRSLHQLGVAQAFIVSLRSTLAGDKQALQQYYLLDYTSESLNQWQLRLTPRDTDLAKKITRIQIKGLFKPTGTALKNRAVVTAVVVYERSGSITTTALEAFE